MQYREYRLRCRWCPVDFGMVHNTDEERSANRALDAHQDEHHADKLAEYHRMMREAD